METVVNLRLQTPSNMRVVKGAAAVTIIQSIVLRVLKVWFLDLV